MSLSPLSLTPAAPISKRYSVILFTVFFDGRAMSWISAMVLCCPVDKRKSMGLAA
jgi:hypothetical protein